MRGLVLSILAAGMATAVALAPAPAAAKACLGVKFTIVNKSPNPIELRMIYFVDKEGKPRRENVPNKKLLPNQTYTTTSALRKVGGQPFSTQVSYRALVPRKSGTAKWSSVRRTDLKRQGKCESSGKYSMSITR